MRDRKTGRIIWYLFSAVLIKWGVEIAVATFALSCGLHSNMGIGAISSIITIPMIGWIYRKDQGRYEKEQESWWKYKAASGYGMWFVMLLGAVTACVAMNDIVMLMNMQKISRVYQSMEQTIYSAPLWLQMAGAGILAPIAEELVYRGMIYRRMRESLTAMQAGVFVSILFGVGHGNLPQGLYAMVLGLLLACIYEKFRNIAAPGPVPYCCEYYVIIAFVVWGL
ncbi:MAG: lysostaphin resistance A-like protein [Dorea sp.]